MNSAAKATENELSDLHGQTAKYMKERLQKALNGEVEMTPAELSAITKFLKDNHIECNRADMEKQFGEIMEFPIPEITEEDAESM